jgi:hypothetical protein
LGSGEASHGDLDEWLKSATEYDAALAVLGAHHSAIALAVIPEVLKSKALRLLSLPKSTLAPTIGVRQELESVLCG